MNEQVRGAAREMVCAELAFGQAHQTKLDAELVWLDANKRLGRAREAMHSALEAFGAAACDELRQGAGA